jgi:hypothetical protein
MVERFAYAAEGWGVGELIFEGGLLAWHELPRPGAEAAGDHPLAGRLRRYFAGSRDAFADVELETDV